MIMYQVQKFNNIFPSFRASEPENLWKENANTNKDYCYKNSMETGNDLPHFLIGTSMELRQTC